MQTSEEIYKRNNLRFALAVINQFIDIDSSAAEKMSVFLSVSKRSNKLKVIAAPTCLRQKPTSGCLN